MRNPVTRRALTLILGAASVFACATPGPTLRPTMTASRFVPTARATGQRGSPAATARPTPPESVLASPTTSPSPVGSASSHTVQSDDGLLTVVVPHGAVPDTAALTATARGGDALPPELEGLEVRSAFYELAPAGIAFAAPVAVARRVSFTDLEIDPSEGLPVLILAIRSADGAWQWATDQTLQRVADSMVVSGHVAYSGMVFAFGGRAFTDVDISWSETVHVGDSVRMAATLRFPDDSVDPPVLGAFEPITVGEFVGIGDAEGPANQSLSQSFVCNGAGSATVGVRYSVLNVGAETALFHQLGLDPATTRVEATAPLTCEASPTAAPS